MNGSPENKTCVLEEIKMKYYVTLTGLNYRFGTQPFTVGQKVKLVKEPENDFDREAIRAELPGLGKVGYVANSTHTVLGDCYSAGRIYDKINWEKPCLCRECVWRFPRPWSTIKRPWC